MLNLSEFIMIKNNLEKISDVWSDLWITLHISQEKPSQLLNLRFKDVKYNVIRLSATKRFAEKEIPLTRGLARIFVSRRRRYPNDIFIFQTHSSSHKNYPKPVSLVAFNTALKKASNGVTPKSVSSRSAYELKLT